MTHKKTFPSLNKKVVLFTIVELFNDDESINHHGFKRMVPEKENRVFTVRKHNEDTDTIKEISNNGLLCLSPRTL